MVMAIAEVIGRVFEMTGNLMKAIADVGKKIGNVSGTRQMGLPTSLVQIVPSFLK